MNTFESICRKLVQTRLTYDVRVKTSELVLLVGPEVYRQMQIENRKSSFIGKVAVREIKDFNIDPFTIILTTKLNIKTNNTETF